MGSIDVKVHDIDTPQGLASLLEFVAEQVVEATTSKLGPGFKTIEDPGFYANPNRIWRSGRIDVAELGKLPTAIGLIIQDIIMNGIRTFVRPPLIPDISVVVEKDGICMRVALDRYPKPVIQIEYIGYNK
jgi:hypothetical protein